METGDILHSKLLTLNQLRTTKVVFNLLYQPIESLLLEMKCVFKHQGVQMLALE